MGNLTYIWRPKPQVRATAIAILRRDNCILCTATTNDDGDITGWRPLGGGIEFGERAEAALVRELSEELQAEAKVLTHLGTMENIFTHHGETGHEIVFVFEAALTTLGITRPDRFVVEDGAFRDQAAWLPLADFRSGTLQLWPEGLIDLVPDAAPA